MHAGKHASRQAGRQAEEKKELYYSITAEMIIAQPSSHSVTDNPGALAARVLREEKKKNRQAGRQASRQACKKAGMQAGMQASRHVRDRI